MYRYVAGRQTFYGGLLFIAGSDDETLVIHSTAAGGANDGRLGAPRRGKALVEQLLTEAQRERLQAFLDRFDEAGGLEPTLRVVGAEAQTFFAFQACKVLQRLAKRFGAEVASSDARLARLLERCTETIQGADAVSVSRALWSLGKMGVRNQALLAAAASRIPAVLGQCGPITLATLWHSCEVLEFVPASCLNSMAEEVLARLQECDPPEVAIVLHAGAQLQFEARERLFSALVPHVREHEGSYSTRHLAMCFHATARVGLRDDKLCVVVAKRFTKSIREIDALALTSAVYACGLLAFFDASLFEAVADYLVRAVANGTRTLESQQISNMVYTFGKLGFCPSRCLEVVARHCLVDFGRFKGQELSNLTYGLALLKFRNEAYMSQLSRHLVEEGRIDSLDAQSLVSMMYSYALLGCLHHTTVRAIGDKAIPKLPDFKPEEFSIMIYSLGLLNYRHHDFIKAIVDHVPPALPAFTPQNLSNLLHGLGLVAFDRDDDFVCQVASHLAGRLVECSAQDIANPITALMRMCVPHDHLLRQIATHITEARCRPAAGTTQTAATATSSQLAEFTTQELANIVYGFDALQVFDQKLFELVARETSARLEEFIPQEVANVVWAFSKQSFGSLGWFEGVLARCAPHTEAPPPLSNGHHSLRVEWCGEDLEKPLAALWHLRHELPSYQRLEKVFRARFLDRIASFLRSLEPMQGVPQPSKYQKDFAAWDLYQVGPLFTQELLESVGVQRVPPSAMATSALLEHYVGAGNENSLLARYGQRLLISVLPAARWVSSRINYRLRPGPGQTPVREGVLVVEPAHPKEDDEANQRRLQAQTWREPVDVARGTGSAWRPVLLSTFLGNWRHRHTELVALDALVEVALDSVREGAWQWREDFWAQLAGDVELVVPHTPCLSCVGAFAQLRCWCPLLQIRVAYQDWREWRQELHKATDFHRGLLRT